MNLQEYYKKNAENYVKHGRVLIPSVLDHFLGFLPEKARLLDLGSGMGQDTEYFNKAEFPTTGLDFSPTMIEYARRFSDYDFVLGDMLTIPFASSSFDGIWSASSLFTHLDKKGRMQALSEVSRSLKAKGVFGGIAKAYHESSVFPFNQFSTVELSQELNRWFRDVSIDEFDHNGSPWLTFIGQNKFRNKSMPEKNTITYSTRKEDLANLEAINFFEGWPNKPSEEVLRKSIENASYVVLAIDASQNKLVGYITALSDGVLSAYIPFLEVEKSYQKRGIGILLVKKMIEQLGDLYMIDLVCDKKLAGFYSETGFRSWHAMIRRNYANQSGAFLGKTGNR